MNKNIIKIITVLFLLTGLIVPLSTLNAHSCKDNFTYRSTVLGGGIKQLSKYTFEISNQKTDFFSNEQIFTLTRIFNISHIGSFQIKQLVINQNGKVVKDFYSETYKPNQAWWAETYSWHNFGVLEPGAYDLNVYIKVDSENFRQIDTKQFNVRGNYYTADYINRGPRCTKDYYDNSCRYNQPAPNCCRDGRCGNMPCNNLNPAPNYEFNWTSAGLNVRQINSSDYEVINRRTDFSIDDSPYVLTKLSNIKNTDKLKVKHEVYLDGNRYYKSYESPEQTPRTQFWLNYYYWSVLGKLPAGRHEVRTYISINGGGYTELNRQSININQPPRSYDRYDYRYDYSQIDNRVNHVNGYIYGINNPKTQFSTAEPVAVLTKLSDIKGIDYFIIKYEYWRDGNSVTLSKEATAQYPRYNNWEYNYSWVDFGALPAGSHLIKIYISVNGGAYKLLETKNITVNSYSNNNYYNGYNGGQNYNYDWTQVGNSLRPY